MSIGGIMKSHRKILFVFILNLGFSFFELVGGFLTGSVAIMSDAIHDFGDAASIGCSYFLERKSKRQPDEKYTFGYRRFSVLGSCITTVILIIGSLVMIYNSIYRIMHPMQIDYSGMILFAVVGVLVNFCAAFLTREGDSLNQKAVNLHMLEDVLGWCVVLLGAIIMHFTDFALLDPIMSICVSVFILINALGNLKDILSVFLEKSPDQMAISSISERILQITGVQNVHHIHLWSLDGQRNLATMHVVSDLEHEGIKCRIRDAMKELGISHITIEMETSSEDCKETVCKFEEESLEKCCHHHHHHHNHRHSH